MDTVGQALKYLEKVSELRVALIKMSLRSVLLGRRSRRMTKRKSLWNEKEEEEVEKKRRRRRRMREPRRKQKKSQKERVGVKSRRRRRKKEKGREGSTC